MTRSKQDRTWNLRINPPVAVAALAIVFVLVVAAVPAAQAQTFTVIHAFTGGNDGSLPLAGLTPAGPGTFYGTAADGGAHRWGLVFKLSHSASGWVLYPLYSFSGNDGGSPESRVTIGPDGALYGTTYQEGANGGGTVYKLTPPLTACRSFVCSWTETVLHSFPDPLTTDGFNPDGDLTFDHAGNVYGTTVAGGSGNPYGCFGSGCGVVYQLTNSQGSWTENIVHQFTGGSDGGNPFAGVLLDQAGNIDGTACVGGVSTSAGLAFQISASDWVETAIYDFQGVQDGKCPYGLTPDATGNLYGTSAASGSWGDGAVYELSPGQGGWNFASLYQFTSGTGGSSPLTRDSAGNLYGTTFSGGGYNYGTVFKLTQSGGSWTYSSLHDFTNGGDGRYPGGQVVVDSSGNVYGVAADGGASGGGIIFEITP